MAYSDDELKKALDGYKPAPEKKEVLSGRVSFTPEQERQAGEYAKAVFPQPDDNPALGALKTALYVPNQVAQGFGNVPEDVANFGLGLAQQGMPQDQRMTAADIVRKVMPNYLSGQEMPQTAAYQAQAAQHPVMSGAAVPSQLVGGLAFPLGQIEGGLMKAPLALAKQGAGLPMLAKLGALGKQVPIAQDVAQTVKALKKQAAMNLLQMTVKSPLVGGVASGAAYGNVFGGGQQFGQTHTLPDAGRATDLAISGGTLGLGFSAVAKALANLHMQNLIKAAAKDSPLEKIPEAAKSLKGVVDARSPQELMNLHQAAMNKLQASAQKKDLFGNWQQLSPDEILQRQNSLASAGEKVGRLTEDSAYGENASKLRAYASKLALDTAKTADRRAYTEQSTTKKQQFTQQQTQSKQKFSSDQANARMKAALDKMRASADVRARERASAENKLEEHVDESDTMYNMLYDEIKNARDKQHLNDLEKMIHASGAGPGGKAVLRGHQRQNLMKQLYRKMDSFRKRKTQPEEAPEEAPGETKVPGASEPKPLAEEVPQNKPALTPPAEKSAGPELELPASDATTTKPASKAAPQKAPDMVPQKSEQSESTPETREIKIKNQLEGAFRKTLNVKEFGNRENRYKLAVSTDALADAAKLDVNDRAALNRWVSELSDTARELTYKKLQIKQLSEWADKNEDAWIGGQNKVNLERKEDADGNMYRLLTHSERTGRYQQMALSAKMEDVYENAQQKNIEWAPAPTADGKGVELREEANPHLQCLTCGKVGDADWHEKIDGSLELTGGIQKLQLPAFKAPKSADELFDQMERLFNRRNYYKQKLAEIKNAQGEFNYAGNGTTPTQIMSKAFDELKLKHLDGQAPNLHVWHVDESGHISTVDFHQPRSETNLEQVQTSLDKKIDSLVARVTDPLTGKIDYNAVWSTPALQNKLLGYFPGLSEIAIAHALFGRTLHKIGRSFARASGIDALFAGTIHDILRDNVRFGGDAIADAFNQMLGEVNANFLHDEHGEWLRIGSPEEKAELLNEFKGVDINKASYRSRAVKDAREKAAKSESPFTTEMQAEAIKRADTALMIRRKWRDLARDLEPHLEQQDIRRRDAKTGIPSKEGRKFYKEDLGDYDDQGRVTLSAYNPLYHEALKELHAGLTLQSSKMTNGLSGFIAETPSRVSQSIMRNNPAVAFKNMWDQLPMSAAYFGRHFFQAAYDYNSMPAVSEAIKRMPVIPAAEMSGVQLAERLADQRKGDIGQQFFKNLDKINHFLSTKLDPIFGGRSPLVSMADREIFAPISALASIYKSAHMRGLDRHEFFNDLVAGNLRPEVEKATMQELTRSLTETLNSVSPDLNKDLWANSFLGRITSAYSTPGRRAMKLWSGWSNDFLYKGDKSAALKLTASFFGLAAFGGRGAVPQSFQTLYGAAASMVGEQEQAERNLQQLDKLNLMKRIGIDWSANFGPDFMTNAKPTLEAIEKMPVELIAAATGAHNPGELAFNVTTTIAFKGFHMFPSVGPVGTSVWDKVAKGNENVKNGAMKQYFEHNGSLQWVPVANYTYSDLLRHVMLGGYEAKASDAVAEKKIQLAAKADAKYRANKAIIPQERKAAIQLKDIFPTRGSKGES